MATEKCKADLDQLLRAGIHCATGLQEILTDERAALESQDTEALNQAATSKQQFLSKLEELEAARREICNVTGFSSDAGAMEEIVKWCDTDSLILGYWNHFIDLARECSELNTRNGAIINVRRQQIAGALSIVRGESRNNETYGRNGRDSNKSAKRVLAEI